MALGPGSQVVRHPIQAQDPRHVAGQGSTLRSIYIGRLYVVVGAALFPLMSTSTSPSYPKNRQPAQPRYRGRNPRDLRKLQQTLSFTKGGRALTAAERGGLAFLCNPMVRDNA